MQPIPARSESLDLGLARLSQLAPSGYALGLHIRFASALMMIQTYDPKWIEVYTGNGYMLCDPIISWAFGTEGACRWSAMDHPDPHGILAKAAEHGLRYGVVISHGPVNSRTIGGFARPDREFEDDEIERIHSTVRLLHEESTPPESLTRAQRLALGMIAQGFRTAEAAVRLGISESALKARLKAVRERLFVRTTAEAIQRAQAYGLL